MDLWQQLGHQGRPGRLLGAFGGLVVADMAGPAECGQVVERIRGTAVLQGLDVVTFQPPGMATILATVSIPFECPPPGTFPQTGIQTGMVPAARMFRTHVMRLPKTYCPGVPISALNGSAYTETLTRQ